MEEMSAETLREMEESAPAQTAAVQAPAQKDVLEDVTQSEAFAAAVREAVKRELDERMKGFAPPAAKRSAEGADAMSDEEYYRRTYR